MAQPVTAQDEILKRIKTLDNEESALRLKASETLTEAARVAAQIEAQAESKAILRRQYEFAYEQLGGELREAKLSSPGAVVVSPGRVIVALASTP